MKPINIKEKFDKFREAMIRLGFEVYISKEENYTRIKIGAKYGRETHYLTHIFDHTEIINLISGDIEIDKALKGIYDELRDYQYNLATKEAN